jgi:hypothetical protein
MRADKIGRKVGRIIRWVVLATCASYLALFFYRNRTTLQVAFGLNWRLLAGMVGLQLVYYPIQAFRLYVVVGKDGAKKPPLVFWLKVFIVGRFLNMVVSQAGHLYRAAYLKGTYGISYARYLGGLVSIAWLDLCVSLSVAIAAILLFEPHLKIGPWSLWRVNAVLLAVAAALPVGIDLVLSHLSLRWAPLEWVRDRMSIVTAMTVGNLRDARCLLIVVGFGVVIFLRTVLLFHLYFLAFGVKTNLPALATFCALFALSSFIMVTPGNIGIQEVAWGFLAEQMGVGMAQGVLVSGFGRVVATSIAVCLGVLLGGADILRHRGTFTRVGSGTHQGESVHSALGRDCGGP